MMGKFMQQTKRGKKKIVILVTISFIVIVVTTAYFLMYNTDIFQEKIAGLLITNTFNGIEHKVDRYFKRIPTVLTTSVAWLQQTELGPGEVAALNGHFMPMLKRLSAVSGVIVADDAAREYFFCRDGETWITRSIDRARFKEQVIFQRWNDAAEQISEWQEESQYVPTDRPWFAGALQKITTDEVFWTDVYTLSSKKKLGISASRAIACGEKGEHFKIVVIDVLLDDVRSLIAKTALSPRSVVALATLDGEFISSNQAATRVYDDELAPPKKFMNGHEGILLNIALGRLRSVNEHIKADRFDLSMQGVRWWVAFRKLAMVNDELVLLIAMPEDEIFAVARDNKMFRISALMAAIAVFILFATIIAMLRRTKSDQGSRIG
jgi:hypothetical protein